MHIEKEEEPFLFAFFLFKFCNQVRKRINIIGKILQITSYQTNKSSCISKITWLNDSWIILLQ